MKLVNEWRFSGLRDVFKGPAAMEHRHRSRPRAPNGNSDGERYCEEWHAHRAWEDDGGCVHPELASVDG